MESSDSQGGPEPTPKITDEQYIAWCYWHSLRAAALANAVTACSRFGVDMPMAMLAATLSIPQLERLAFEVDMVILRPRVTAKQLSTILNTSATSRLPFAARIAARLAGGVPDGRPRASTHCSPTTNGVRNENEKRQARA